jgi:hypothetical protein
MAEEITDLEYVHELLADFDLRPKDKIADLIEALEEVASNDEEDEDDEEEAA